MGKVNLHKVEPYELVSLCFRNLLQLVLSCFSADAESRL